MKKIVLIIALLMTLMVFTGAIGATQLSIVGTGSGMPVLTAVGELFTQKHQDILINIPESIGSGGGVKMVGNERFKIGRIAREIREKEKQYGLTYTPFCKMPIIFFVNKSCGITGLTPQEVCGIYSGRITNWKELGGKDAGIRVVRREDGDSSLSILKKKFPGFAQIEQTSRSKTTFTDQSTFEIVENKENTIAYGTYIDSLHYDVTILAINQMMPSDPEYSYVAVLAFIYKQKNYNGDLKKFVEFALSSEPDEVIKAMGGYPF